MPDYEIKITARGPLADRGTLPLAEMARLLGEFQQTLERIALRVQGIKNVTGRRPVEVTAAVRLEFTEIRLGSAQLLIRQAENVLANETLQSTFDILASGGRAIRQGSELPEAFDLNILHGILKFSGGLNPGQLNSLDVEVDGQRILNIDAEFRELTRALTRQRTTRETTIVGLLQMTDFAPSSLKCRFDTLNESILCDFDATLKDAVLEHVDTLVEARGIGQFTAAGDRLLSLDLLSVSGLALASYGTIDDLAAEQGIQPWGDHNEISLGDQEVTDEEFESFFISALSGRPVYSSEDE